MQQLILLHGAIGAQQQWDALRAMLAPYYQVHTLNFYGHGGTELPGSPFSIAGFADQLLQFIDAKQLHAVNLFGYSMGGYVALYLAKQHPERIQKIITLGTKFNWDEATAAREVKMLDPVVMEQKIPAFVNVLRQRHAPQNWELVLHKTAEMMTAMGKENPLLLQHYAGIETPSLIMLGDRDKTVTLEETIAVYRQLPHAQFAVLPGTPHPLEQVNLVSLMQCLQGFL
jgi:pimeloyl-ACP methyl ester carboxylesterase